MITNLGVKSHVKFIMLLAAINILIANAVFAEEPVKRLTPQATTNIKSIILKNPVKVVQPASPSTAVPLYNCDSTSGLCTGHGQGDCAALQGAGECRNKMVEVHTIGDVYCVCTW